MLVRGHPADDRLRRHTSRCSHWPRINFAFSLQLRRISLLSFFFFFSSRRRHTRFKCDWSSDVCSSDLGSPWWSACKAELDLRNGQQLAEASVAMSRVTEKMRSSTQHFEQLADTLCQATNDVADLLRKTEEAGRRPEIAVYVAICVSLVPFFNLIFEVFRKR